MWMWQKTLLQTFVKFGVNLTFLHLGYHGNSRHFDFFNTQKLPHTMVDIPTKYHEVWWKESKLFLNPPFFVSMATAAKFVQLILIFLAYLVPLFVDVGPIKFHQFLFVLTMFHEVWWKKSKNLKNPPFLISMATAASFVLPISIFCYLVPLDVDVKGNITLNICEAWSEYRIVCTLATMATAATLIFVQPPKKSCYTLRWIFLQSFMKIDERDQHCF